MSKQTTLRSLNPLSKSKVHLAILVAALGYFVDVYDIILFSVIRVPSLKALGLPEAQITSMGLILLNIQLVGMLIGGFAFGSLGDKKGRLMILFGSILIYSLANLANAYVTNIEQYAILRFLAGFGLAGEFGAGITLISEIMSKEKRGYGTTIVTTAGVLGGIAGGFVGNLLSWQSAFIVGGIAGIVLLLLRLSVIESPLFTKINATPHIPKGAFFKFFKNWRLTKKYLNCLFVGIPFFVFVGLLMALSPELSKALHVKGTITVGWSILFFNVGLGLGDLSSGILSQIMQTRKKIIHSYLFLTFIFTTLFFTQNEASPSYFYFLCGALGFGVGYWAVFMMVSAEQFGTNLRALVTVSLPNVVRAMVIPFTIILSFLKPSIGIVDALSLIALGSIITAWFMLFSLEETFSKELDYTEALN